MASFRKRGIATSCPADHTFQTKTFEPRAEAESTTLKELLERYLEEVTPLKKGAEPETNRLRLRWEHIDLPRSLHGDVFLGVASITGNKDLRMLRRYTHLKAEDLAHSDEGASE